MTEDHMRLLLLSVLASLSLSCKKEPPLPQGQATPKTYFTAQLADSRFYVADHFLASIEMQISGEPFAQLLGRNLAGYDRFNKTPDLYIDPATGHTSLDPLSYSMAIESYEYSKQPMNNTSFESGAGLSLQYGPVLNPGAVTGDAAFVLLRDRLQQFAMESASGGCVPVAGCAPDPNNPGKCCTPGTSFVVVPAPSNNPLNVYGWAGYWPIFAEFESFAPDITPSGVSVRGCSITGGYAASQMGAQVVGDYECGYNSLNLAIRDAQVTKVLSPAAMGFALWKQGLWTINYWQSVHDLAGNGITSVADADIPMVGQAGNTVVGQYPDPNDPTGKNMLSGAPGVYLGDIPLEGWQGLTMLDEMHNKSVLLLQRILTSDGAAPGGFASTKDAISYDYSSALQWWPAEIAVTEINTDAPAAGAWKYFPQPTRLSITTATSRLRDLAALDGGFAEFFALTDFNNASVGGQVSSRATFDGDPFPADNGMPDGEDTPHDRALSVIKVATVDMDRLHFDSTNKVLVDEATVTGGAVQRGTRVTTVDAAYAIVGLRTAWRSISSQLALYSNDTPDQHGGATALDGAKLDGAPAPLPDRMVQLITAQADFIASRLVASDGSVANYFDLQMGAPDPSPTRLESEASAIRGLLDAYLATSNESYRQTAIKVYADLDKRFWMSDVRAFRTVAGESNTLTWTPLVFGTIQGALRQYWKLVAQKPGNERLASELLERVQRTNKLVANGWDDANGDNKVQYPDECTGAGLQMGERVLTGELAHTGPIALGLGLGDDGDDRDHDCVKEISQVKKPAALAGKIVLTRRQ
jgi:hypothetical protein